MRKIITILWAMLFSLCTWAQGSERLRDHQIPAKLEEFLQYANSLGYGTTVHSNPHEKQKVDFFFPISNRKDENVILFLDSIRHTFYALADEAQETYFWESHKDGIDSIEYALKFDNGHLKLAYKPYSTVEIPDRGFAYLTYMGPTGGIKPSITENNDKKENHKNQKTAPVLPTTPASPTTNTSKPSGEKKKITFTPLFNHVK